MNTLRWIFFLTLSILLIASCNNASAEFHSDRSQALTEDQRVFVVQTDETAAGAIFSTLISDDGSLSWPGI